MKVNLKIRHLRCFQEIWALNLELLGEEVRSQTSQQAERPSLRTSQESVASSELQFCSDVSTHHWHHRCSSQLPDCSSSSHSTGGWSGHRSPITCYLRDGGIYSGGPAGGTFENVWVLFSSCFSAGLCLVDEEKSPQEGMLLLWQG